MPPPPPRAAARTQSIARGYAQSFDTAGVWLYSEVDRCNDAIAPGVKLLRSRPYPPVVVHRRIASLFVSYVDQVAIDEAESFDESKALVEAIYLYLVFPQGLVFQLAYQPVVVAVDDLILRA